MCWLQLVTLVARSSDVEEAQRHSHRFRGVS